MSSIKVKLPKVQSQKELIDHLENSINPPKYDEDGDSRIGRLKELKTYILESDGGFPKKFQSDDMSYDVLDTGLPTTKILRVISKNTDNLTTEFFLDTSDDRFFMLHTNERTDQTNKIIEKLVKDLHHTFDHTWFHSNMLKRLAGKQGNTFKGFGVNYSNEYLEADELSDSDIEDLTLNINGSLAEEMQKIIEGYSEIDRRVAFYKVRILRGSKQSPYNSVQDDVHNDGCFAIKRGKSVQDHLQLVDIAKNEYVDAINDVEDQRIGLKTIEDRTLVEGRSFDFEFPNPIEDITVFLQRFFNSAPPFRLWGIKTKIYDDYFKVYGVDLHTSSIMDFEITKDMMRVYLFKGSCGNTVLRLFTNLQLYFDSKIKCEQLM